MQVQSAWKTSLAQRCKSLEKQASPVLNLAKCLSVCARARGLLWERGSMNLFSHHWRILKDGFPLIWGI